jgi:AcrR family transcriptional regulator
VAKRKQAIDSKRRKPRQARARTTVATIFEAAIQILERDGYEALTTNRIAERAGVSVSTLYQYFENNDALLFALAEHVLSLHRASVGKLMAESLSVAQEEWDRHVIRSVLAATSKQSRLYRMTIEMMIARGHSKELAAPSRDIEQLLVQHAARFLPGVNRTLSAVSLFVLTRAIQGVMHAALREEVSFMGTEEFETELTRVLRGYVAQLRSDASLKIGL